MMEWILLNFTAGQVWIGYLIFVAVLSMFVRFRAPFLTFVPILIIALSVMWWILVTSEKLANAGHCVGCG